MLVETGELLHRLTYLKQLVSSKVSNLPGTGSEPGNAEHFQTVFNGLFSPIR